MHHTSGLLAAEHYTSTKIILWNQCFIVACTVFHLFQEKQLSLQDQLLPGAVGGPSYATINCLQTFSCGVLQTKVTIKGKQGPRLQRVHTSFPAVWFLFSEVFMLTFCELVVEWTNKDSGDDWFSWDKPCFWYNMPPNHKLNLNINTIIIIIMLSWL